MKVATGWKGTDVKLNDSIDVFYRAYIFFGVMGKESTNPQNSRERSIIF